MSSSPIYIPPEGLRVRIQSYATSWVLFTVGGDSGLGVGDATDPLAGWWTFLHGSGNHTGRYAIKCQTTGEVLFSRGSSPVVGTVKGDGQDEDNWFELEPGSGKYTDHFRLITSEGWKLTCPWRSSFLGAMPLLVNTCLSGSFDSDQFFGFIWEDMKVDRVEYNLAAGVIGTATPIALGEEVLTNDSGTEQEMSFAVNQGITCSSTFEYSTGFKVTVDTEFSAGVPLVSEATFKIEVSTENTWTWGKTTEYNSQYTATFPVKTAAHTAVRASAVVTKGTLNVPYTMHLSSKSTGVEVQTSGTWRGVSSWDLRFTITDIGPKFRKLT